MDGILESISIYSLPLLFNFADKCAVLLTWFKISTNKRTTALLKNRDIMKNVEAASLTVYNLVCLLGVRAAWEQHDKQR